MEWLLNLTLVPLCWGHLPSFWSNSCNIQPQHTGLHWEILAVVFVRLGSATLCS